MIFIGAAEYFVYLGLKQAKEGLKPVKLREYIKNDCREAYHDGYILGKLDDSTVEQLICLEIKVKDDWEEDYSVKYVGVTA